MRRDHSESIRLSLSTPCSSCLYNGSQIFCYVGIMSWGLEKLKRGVGGRIEVLKNKLSIKVKAVKGIRGKRISILGVCVWLWTILEEEQEGWRLEKSRSIFMVGNKICQKISCVHVFTRNHMFRYDALLKGWGSRCGCFFSQEKCFCFSEVLKMTLINITLKFCVSLLIIITYIHFDCLF